ncbi:unnamed protein product [Musa acuminata var. zebrina]
MFVSAIATSISYRTQADTKLHTQPHTDCDLCRRSLVFSYTVRSNQGWSFEEAKADFTVAKAEATAASAYLLEAVLAAAAPGDLPSSCLASPSRSELDGSASVAGSSAWRRKPLKSATRDWRWSSASLMETLAPSAAAFWCSAAQEA